MPTTEPLIDACIELLHFTKLNEFPEKGTDEFFQLTALLDKIETVMLTYCLIGPNTFKKPTDGADSLFTNCERLLT